MKYSLNRIIVIAAAAAIAAIVPATAQAQGFPSKWKLTKSNHTSFEQLWEADSSHIKATECGQGWLDAPKCEKMSNGDCWVFHFPVDAPVQTKGKNKGFALADNYFEFDLMLGSQPASPTWFALEYLDGDKWVTKDMVKCIGGTNEPTAIIETFKLAKGVRNGEVLVRLRVFDDTPCRDASSPKTAMRMMPYGYIAGYANHLGTAVPKDTTRIGYLGNSFTFVNSADFILKELAWNEGHYLDMNVSTYPGAYFRSHLGLPGSMDVITEGGYDWFFLQDQSTQAAKFGRDSTVETSNFTKAIAKVIRYFSPETDIILEQTWAFSKNNFNGFGSYAAFDSCSTVGAARLAKAADAKVSPIAQAFAIVRLERPDIVIYSTDDHHPGAYGAYLKACVNHLTIFGTPFTSDKANYAMDPEACAYLREVAQRVVLGKK